MGRNKSKTSLPSPYRQKQMVRAIDLYQDATRQEYMEVKPTFLPYGELDLYNNYMLKDLNYIDCFSNNFPCHFVLNQVDCDTNLLDNVNFTKNILQPTRKQRSVGPHKLKSE